MAIGSREWTVVKKEKIFLVHVENERHGVIRNLIQVMRGLTTSLLVNDECLMQVADMERAQIGQLFCWQGSILCASAYQ